MPLIAWGQDATSEPPVDDLLVSLVPATATVSDDDLLAPLVPPTATSELDDLLVPLTTAVPTTAPISTQSTNPNMLPPGWTIPKQGIYVREYGETTRSGDCSQYEGGDNDGPGSAYNPDDPRQQATLCAVSGIGSVFLDNNMYQWDRNGSPSLYVTDTRVDSFDNSESHFVMSVVDDSTVDVFFVNTQGTCTVTTSIRYTLYMPGYAYSCTQELPQSRPDVEENEPQPTPLPEEESAAEDEPIDQPIVVGDYAVRWVVFNNECADAYKPSFTDVALSQSRRDNVTLGIEGESYALDGEAESGEFSFFVQGLSIELERRFMTDFNFSWQALSDDNQESCYAQGVLELVSAAEDQSNFIVSDGSNATDNNAAGHSGAGLPVGGDFDVTWTPMEGMACSADVEAQLPTFAQVTITDVTEESFTMDTDMDDYLVELIPGAKQWMYMSFGADNSGLIFNFTTLEAGHVVGTLSYIAPDNSMCVMNMEAVG